MYREIEAIEKDTNFAEHNSGAYWLHFTQIQRVDKFFSFHSYLKYTKAGKYCILMTHNQLMCDFFDKIFLKIMIKRNNGIIITIIE